MTSPIGGFKFDVTVNTQQAQAEVSLMTEYRCRACGRLMFCSDARSGRLEMTCPARRCRVLQTVYLGGRFSERRVHLSTQQRAPRSA